MTHDERVAVVAAMMAWAILEFKGHCEMTAAEVLFKMERRSGHLHEYLAHRPWREKHCLAAIKRGMRSYEHWRREGKPCELDERLRPAAKDFMRVIR